MEGYSRICLKSDQKMSAKSHTQIRAFQRYGLIFTESDFAELNKICTKREGCRFLGFGETPNRIVLSLTYKSKKIKVAFDTIKSLVVTILP